MTGDSDAERRRASLWRQGLRRSRLGRWRLRPRTLRHLLVPAAIALLLASASAASTSPTATSNRRAAEATAMRLLEEAPLPDGAQQESSDESILSVLGGPGTSLQRTPQLVQAHRFWRVSGAPEQVISWIEAHPPARFRTVEHGSSATGGEPTSWDVIFSLGKRTPVLSTVWLSMLAAAAKGGGTAVRVDASVVWTRLRPASERIPTSVKVVSVRVRDLRRRIFFSENLSDPAKVRKIVAMIEGLLRPEGGAASCPAADGRDPVVWLAFRDSAAAPPLARAKIDTNACSSVQFWRGRRIQPPLGYAFEALKALHKVLKRTL